MSKSKPNATDVEVGARVRALRVKLGLSQEKLADYLDLTFQQVQKYEKGVNRMGGSRLAQIAKILKVPVSTLFGESGDGGEAVDGRINTRVRGRIIDRLVELDNAKIDGLVLHMLDCFADAQ